LRPWCSTGCSEASALPGSYVFIGPVLQHHSRKQNTVYPDKISTSLKTSFLKKFHTRMGANVRDGPVHPHQTKHMLYRAVLTADLTNPCLLAHSS